MAATVLRAEQRHKDLKAQADDAFLKRSTLMLLWQEIADNFYVERADFTVTRTMGVNWADFLMTGFPLLTRRELGDQLGQMLRPDTKEYAEMSVARADKLDDGGRLWLQAKTQVMRRAMSARASMFARATKAADHDFVAFGQAVLSTQLNRYGDDLLFQCHHLRDVAWHENADGNAMPIYRRWKTNPSVADATFRKSKFCNGISDTLKKRKEKAPFETCELMHFVVEADNYEPPQGQKRWLQPYVSIWIESDTMHCIEEVGCWNPIYTIPRWLLVSGSQYSYSPATVVALPDARVIQSVTLTLLEAGEKYTNPPLLATKDAVRSDIDMSAGGVTWLDYEYDERLGDALRPLTQDKSGYPIGEDVLQRIEQMITRAMYLDKLTMPAVTNNPNMTAFQVGQIVQSYIRQALPLFAPIEEEYNARLFENTFDVMLRAGAFGPLTAIPQSILSGNPKRPIDVQFKFTSPLTDAVDAQLAGKLQEGSEILAQAAALDPTVAAIPKAHVAVKDALLGIGFPQRWLNSDQAIAAANAKAKQQQAIDGALGRMQQGANVVKTLGGAGQGPATQTVPAAAAAG